LTPVSRNLGLWLLLLLFGLIFWSIVTKQQPRDTEITFTRFIDAVEGGKVATVTIQGQHIRGQYKDEPGHPGESFKTFTPEDPTLWSKLRDKAIERIHLGLGYEYDPRVVDALVRVLAYRDQ
jgi:cell division protease FtsH